MSDFRPSASGSGLLVPEAISREREVWTRDEWKALDKTMALLTGRGVQVFLKCDRAGCAPIERLRRPTGEMVLRCGHKDRVFIRTTLR